jgi:hypothetical protein
MAPWETRVPTPQEVIGGDKGVERGEGGVKGAVTGAMSGGRYQAVSNGQQIGGWGGGGVGKVGGGELGGGDGRGAGEGFMRTIPENCKVVLRRLPPDVQECCLPLDIISLLLLNRSLLT